MTEDVLKIALEQYRQWEAILVASAAFRNLKAWEHIIISNGGCVPDATRTEKHGPDCHATATTRRRYTAGRTKNPGTHRHRDRDGLAASAANHESSPTAAAISQGLSVACTLSLESVLAMTEDEAREAFARIRWHDGNGKPSCCRCGCIELYTCKAEKLWKCKDCGFRFSLTSGTIFASRKLPVRDILAAIAILANPSKRYSALQLSRDLDVQYRTAWALAQKIRKVVSKPGPRNDTATSRQAARRPRALSAATRAT
jgi:transposase-like protein